MLQTGLVRPLFLVARTMLSLSLSLLLFSSFNVRQIESGDERGALDDAKWLSLISFSWLNQLFRTGAARQIRAEDLPQLARQDRAAVWADRCERAT